MKKELIVIGGGGHAKVVIDAIKCGREFEICGIVDPKLPKGSSVLGIKVIGSDGILPAIFKKGTKYAFIAVGSIGEPGVSVRKNIDEKLKEIGFKLPVIIHPKTIVAKDVEFGEGVFVAAGAVINPGTKIGRNAIINTRASVDHDCEIGDFVHIAPGVTLSGGVKVGEDTHIGTGARIIQNIYIGNGCMVGAGAIVRDDLKGDQRALLTPRSRVSANKKVFIIAEAGVNHNGDVAIAKNMVDAAKKAGADAVKFQTFKAERIISKFAPKAEYQKKTTGEEKSQLEMVKKLELDINAHHKLMVYCKKRGIMFLSTPFDIESVDLLNDLGLEIFKIPSGEITNLPYLRKIGGLKKRIIISTGMADLKEIKNALDILQKSGTKKKDITILQCNTEYPTPYEDANLLAMLAIKDKLGVNVGYSDHTLGIEVPIAAVALGASVIEKHFTLDRNMKGPDHVTSLEPGELKSMVNGIRHIEAAMGDGIKRPSASELKNRLIARKSIVAARDIEKMERLTEENITVKRPGTGISPTDWDKVIGKIAKKCFKKDELIRL